MAAVHSSVVQYDTVLHADDKLKIAIRRLEDLLQQIRDEELDRYSKKMSRFEFQKAQQVSRCFVEAILQVISVRLDAASKCGNLDPLLDGLSHLFSLKENSIKSKQVET